MRSRKGAGPEIFWLPYSTVECTWCPALQLILGLCASHVVEFGCFARVSRRTWDIRQQSSLPPGFRVLCSSYSTWRASCMFIPKNISAVLCGSRVATLRVLSRVQRRGQVISGASESAQLAWRRSVLAACPAAFVHTSTSALLSAATPSPHDMARARTYADVNTERPSSYWDYEALSVAWGYVMLCYGTGCARLA